MSSTAIATDIPENPLIMDIMYEALLDAQEWMLLNGKKIKSVDDAVDRYRETYKKSSGDTD